MDVLVIVIAIQIERCNFSFTILLYLCPNETDSVKVGRFSYNALWASKGKQQRQQLKIRWESI